MDIDYKKLYNETLQKLYEMISKGIITEEVAKGICADFAVESEDEKIRQFFIHEVEGTSEEIMSYRGMNKESVLAWLKKQDGRKPAEWSEEDEEHLNSIISDIKTDMGAYPRSQEVIDIYNDDISFLKSLRDRVQPQQKQEWSEEDEDYYDAIIAKLEVTQDDAGLTDNQMEFLKSIKQRIGG